MAPPGPLLSFIVPVRGDATELPQLRVILDRRDPRSEWIVVVDGDAGAVVTTALERIRHVEGVIIIHRPAAGPGAARNAGLACAQGRFVAFVDCDDRADVAPFLQLAEEMSLADARVGVLGYSVMSTTDPGTVLESDTPPRGMHDGWERLRRRAGIWRFAFDRDLIVSHRIEFPEQSYAEDLLFLVRTLCIDARTWGLPRIGYEYRLHTGGQLTSDPLPESVVDGTLTELAEAAAGGGSRHQARVLESWMARIWLRRRRSVVARRPSTAGLMASTRVIRGLGWSLAWVGTSPAGVRSLLRTRAIQRNARKLRRDS